MEKEFNEKIAKFNEKITKVFPGAIPESEFVSAVTSQSLKEEFRGEDTVFGDCTCRDENQRKIVNALEDFYGERFFLGALGAMPGIGSVGINAYAHHSPDQHKLAVVFLPHIGYDTELGVGFLYRPGLSEKSSSCGALVGFLGKYRKAAAEGKEFEPISCDEDREQNLLETSLGPFMQGVLKADEPLIALTEKAYDVGLGLLRQRLDLVEQDYILFTAIHINTSPGHEDYLVPKDVFVRKQGVISVKKLEKIV